VEKQNIPSYSLSFDTTGNQTHDLSHGRQARYRDTLFITSPRQLTIKIMSNVNH
jgi:hypothetical protein